MPNEMNVIMLNPSHIAREALHIADLNNIKSEADYEVLNHLDSPYSYCGVWTSNGLVARVTHGIDGMRLEIADKIINYSSKSLTLSMDEFADKYIKPSLGVS